MSRWLKKVFGRARRFLRRFHPRARRFARLHATFAASVRGAHIVALNDARKIFRTVRSCRARRALDLGTGIGASAAFI